MLHKKLSTSENAQVYAKYRANYLIHWAARRAKSKKLKLPFDLRDYRWAIQARIDRGFCELSGVPFTLTGVGSRTFSPSIDRIDRTKGYVYSNIRIVCYAMNSALGEWGEEILYMIVSGWLAKRKKR